MDKPLVSVILTAYNCTYFGNKNIQSVLNKGYLHLELILVDEASTDQIESIKKEIYDHRERYYKLPSNHRASYA